MTVIFMYVYIMKIPNYDIDRNENKKRRLNRFLDEEYRILVCGQPACGKTNTTMHMLCKPLVHYGKIYFYTPNNTNKKIQDLKMIMDRISDKVGYDFMEIRTQDEIMERSEHPVGNRKIVVFDDIVNASDKIQSKVANYFTDGRHDIILIYLSQSYY